MKYGGLCGSKETMSYQNRYGGKQDKSMKGYKYASKPSMKDASYGRVKEGKDGYGSKKMKY